MCCVNKLTERYFFLSTLCRHRQQWLPRQERLRVPGPEEHTHRGPRRIQGGRLCRQPEDHVQPLERDC